MEVSEDRFRLSHMYEAAGKAGRFLGSASLDEFLHHEVLCHAVEHLLTIIGEAASRVSPGCRSAHPEIPWGKIVGMRNRLIHGYHDVDLSVVWGTVAKDLQPLQQALQPLLASS